MEKQDKAKELTKSPFKHSDKLQKEMDLFTKLIEKTAKSTIASEACEELEKEFEQELLKVKDPIDCWVKGYALSQLGYPETGLLFQLKAMELGYVVDSSLNESLATPIVGRRIKLIEIKESFGLVENGTEAEIVSIDEINNIHVKLDNGSKFAVVPSEDKFEILNIKSITEQKIEWLGDKNAEILKINDNEVTIKFFDAVDNEKKEQTMSRSKYDEIMKKNISEKSNQAFLYSNDEVNANTINPDDKIEKPEYNDIALRAMIDNDAFLRFSYHELSTGDQEKDLDKMYKSYVKGDDEMLRKLATFEKYVLYKESKNNN